MNRKRLLVVGGFLAFGTVLAIVSFLARSDRTAREPMTAMRGQTPTVDPSVSMNRGRLGSEASVPSGVQTWTGVLVDAGCADRNRASLHTAPDTSMPGHPGSTGSADRTSANGIDVNSSTARSERGDAMEHQVPDLRSRQPDAACAVTGATRGFALYTPDGQLKNLDEGGNTQAMAAIQGTPTGEAILNGRAAGEKPRATVTGKVTGDRIVVQSIHLQR
jgi:hypothetical protein